MKEEKKDLGKKKNRLTVADVMVPVVSGLIFLLVLFFVLIPSIENSQQMLLEIEKLKKEEDALQANLNLVESIHFIDLQADLANAREVLPQRLEVAQFAYYIDSLARQKELEFKDLKASDVGVGAQEEEVGAVTVKGIRVPMGYSGDYKLILEFFDELQIASPYVISFGHKVELAKSNPEDSKDSLWSLEIDVTGYYVEEEEDISVAFNPKAPFIPYNSQEDLVSEFAERVEIFKD